jgi:hypothetical protein
METEARGDKIIQGSCGYAYSYPKEDQPQQAAGREAEDQDDRHQQAAQLVPEEPPDEVDPDRPSSNEGSELDQLFAEKY